MSIVHAPDSEYAKEMVKWEALPTRLGDAGRPYVKRIWPSWVFLAGRGPNGGIEIVESECIDQHQWAYYRGRGFCQEPLEAIAAFEAQQTEFATLAAEREYDKRHKLSPKAAAEVAAVEQASAGEHLPTIPERPKKAVDA